MKEWAYLIGRKFGPREVHKNKLRPREVESNRVENSILLSWPENQGILFFYISQTLQMNRISFMAFLLNAVL